MTAFTVHARRVTEAIYQETKGRQRYRVKLRHRGDEVWFLDSTISLAARILDQYGALSPHSF